MWPFSPSAHSLVIKEHLASRDRLLYKNALSSDGSKDADILSSDIAGMVSGIQSGRWTATELLEAFIRSTRRAQERTNCLTEVAFDAALKRAKELDEEFKETGKLRGALHGVPFSLKDCYHLEGTHLTIGFSSWLKNGRSTESAAIVRLAEAHGAVCFVQTNVPQTMIAIDSRNPLFGQTGNPWAPAHVAGGSSGGEASLLGADGSAFGIGSDIGGSLRIPAHFCGIYSLKPSSGRYPNAGTCKYNEGFHSIHVVTAPMTRSLPDLELLHTLNIETLHPTTERGELSLRDTQRRFGAENLVPAPLRPLWLNALDAVEKRGGRPLRFGYFLTDGFSKTSPACIRAVLRAKEALEAKHGKQVEFVELKAEEIRAAHAMRVFLSIMGADRFRSARKHIHPDAVDPAMKLAFLLPSLPAFIRVIFVFIVRYIIRDRAFAYVAERACAKTAGGLIAAQAEADDFVDHWNEAVWQRHRLDGIVCPVFALPAPKHHGTDEISVAVAPTALFNLLDNPAVTLPVLRVDAKLDAASSAKPSPYWKGENFKDCSKLLAHRMYGSSAPIYDAAAMAGLPVGVQVVTQRYEDEKAIGLAKLLDEALGERGFGPGAFSRAQKSA